MTTGRDGGFSAQAPHAAAPAILAGLRVVEFSAFVAAPLAGATLAAMGADVIRLEQRGGGIDAGRWPMHAGRSLYRAGLDQGKRSLAIDLRSTRGQELAVELIAGGGESGGIVVSNLGARDWMAYEHLREKRPDLIMVLITGLPDGAAAVDYTVNAGTGFPWITGPENWIGPVNNALPAWDLTTGVLAATAVLAAERHRRLTGQGQLVRIALSDVALGVAAHLGLLAEAELIEEPRRRLGNGIFGSFGRDFRTRDGRFVMVCALTSRQWNSLVVATGQTEACAALEATHQVDLRDEAARYSLREEIGGLIEPWIASRTLAEVRACFEANDVLWGPYRTFKELVHENPQARSPYASPIDFGAFERAPAASAPLIGANTEELLMAELGLGSARIAELRQQGVID